MVIKEAIFVKSSASVTGCPPADRPEFAFLGRSNVGKSSFLNMLAGKGKIAKVSGSPGKTRLINHFLINNHWYMVDLPGYGYARVSKNEREKFLKIILGYLTHRPNLTSLFLLVDCRHEPLKPDLQFIEWLGVNGIPFSLCFTKSDKLGDTQLAESVKLYKRELLKSWEELPPIFITSAPNKRGRDDVLSFLDSALENYPTS